jgi:hypothetical protein
MTQGEIETGKDSGGRAERWQEGKKQAQRDKRQPRQQRSCERRIEDGRSKSQRFLLR